MRASLRRELCRFLRESHVEMGFERVDSRHAEDRPFDLVHVLGRRELAVQHRDPVSNGDVHVWKIAALLEGTERRPNPVGEHVVTHVRIGARPRQAIPLAGQETTQATDPTGGPALDDPARTAAPAASPPSAPICSPPAQRLP